MKQFKNRKSSKDFSTNKNELEVNATKTNNKMLNEIDKLKKQIQSTNQDIKKTQKMLDVDLFLKQQKQKRLDYAKNINAEYEAQKKMREEKLYKKFKRQDRQQNNVETSKIFGNTIKSQQKLDQTINENKSNEKMDFKFQNIPVLNPMSIAKIILNQRGPDEWVKDGHHYKPQDIKTEGLRISQEKMFESLYLDPNEKKKYDGDLQSQHYNWRHIKQVASNPLQMVTTPSQIGQNQLIPNNFHAQNIIGALTFMNSKINSQTFAQNSQIFLAQLFSPEEQVTVIIDKFIKIRQFVHKYVNLGSRSSNPNIMWPTLVEKVFQKLKITKNMSHLSNSIGKTIYTFFGLDPEIIPISNKNVIKQNFHLVLGYLIHEGAVGFMNINGHSKNSYENRVYPLEEVREQVVKRGKLEKKQIRYKIKNPWRGKLLHGQNTNRFNLLQLLQLFNCLILLRDYPQKYQCFRIKVSYFSNGSISPTTTQWTKNPQYLFTITKPTNIRIILRKSGQLTQSKQQKQSVYGFLLFQNKQASNKIEALKMDWLIVKTKSVDIGQATYCAEMPRGNYILIPYSTQQSVKEYQFYVLDFVVEKETNIQFGKARFYDYNYVDKKGARLNTGQAKIIQSLQSNEHFEKPKIQKIQPPSQFKPQYNEQTIQKLNLNIYQKCSIKNYFIPGQISNLLINKSIQVELKQKKDLGTQIVQNQELKREENANNLEILLGYDVIMGDEDINQGLMKELVEQSVGIYDFRDFGLGQQGLLAILQALGTHPQLISIDLSGNDLDVSSENIQDYSITFLCYSMQKGNRTQLRQLNIQRNKFGKIGKNALKGLKGTFPKLQIKGLQ